MSEQQSQKRGVRSEAQKTPTARNAHHPLPAANPVAGAFGAQQKSIPTDKDDASSIENSRIDDEQAGRGGE